MAVTAINITIEQGADFTATYNIKNPDESVASLADYTAVGTIKKIHRAVIFFWVRFGCSAFCVVSRSAFPSHLARPDHKSWHKFVSLKYRCAPEFSG